MPARNDSELLEWLDTLARLAPERYAELRAQIGRLAQSEETVDLFFSALDCMLSNTAELPSAAPLT